MATKKATSAKKKTSAAKSSTKTTVRAASASTRSRTASLRAALHDGPVPVAALLAEFVGTFVLAGIILATSGNQLIILFGLTAIVFMVAAVSGAHLNPALTVAAWVTRRIGGLKALGYVVAQLLGAMAAYLLLNSMLQGTVDQATAALSGQSAELFKVQPLTAGKEWYAFWAEVVGAALFGFGVAAAWKAWDVRNSVTTAMTVGGSLFVALLLAGKTAILNPAVAVAVGAFDFSKAVVWPLSVWVLAAVIGATAGMALYNVLRADKE
jgi:glycerol uptake facilitator-like aquaporin